MFNQAMSLSFCFLFIYSFACISCTDLKSIDKVVTAYMRAFAPSRNGNRTLKNFVSNVALGGAFKTWNEVMADLTENHRRISHKSPQKIIKFTSNIASTVISRVTVGMNPSNHHQRRYHQSSMSAFYALIIRDFTGNIPDLIQLITVMMQMNERLFIGMDTVVWNHWFQRYFNFEPETMSIRSLLVTMTESGSELQPNDEILEVIIDTILSNKAIKDSDAMIERIVNEFKTYNVKIPLQSQFQLRLRDGDRVQMMRFLRLHPEIRFKGASLALFNDILGNLSRDHKIQWFNKDGSLEEKIVFIVNGLLPFYEMTPDPRTYRILRDLYLEFPQYARTLNSLKCW